MHCYCCSLPVTVVFTHELALFSSKFYAAQELLIGDMSANPGQVKVASSVLLPIAWFEEWVELFVEEELE